MSVWIRLWAMSFHLMAMVYKGVLFWAAVSVSSIGAFSASPCFASIRYGEGRVPSGDVNDFSGGGLKGIGHDGF